MQMSVYATDYRVQNMTVTYSNKTERGTHQPTDPHMALAAAVVQGAVRDVQRRTKRANEARAWLASDDCAQYCDALGINHDVVKRWLAQQQPQPAKAGQTLSNMIRQAILDWIHGLVIEEAHEQTL
jgi:hypothetical protein